jgi:NitT/TauT family transport system substrate-binding protein
MRAITGGIAALALLLAGCGGGGGGSAAPAGEGGTTKLSVQETAGVPSAFVAFGIEKGIFDKHKLQIDLQPTQGGAATIPALVSGDIQVGGSNVVSLLLASSKDLPIQAIAGGTSARASGEKDFGALLVKGKGISKPEDLEGKTVAVNTLNNIAEVVVKAALEKDGVDPNSLKLSEVPFPEMEPALAKGSVDAAFSIEPFVTQSVQKGDKVLGYSYVDTESDMQVGAYAVTNQFAESSPEAVEAFQAAVKETAEYVSGNEDEFRTFLSENAKMPPALAKKIVLPRWTGEVDADSVANTAQLMQKYGVVQGELDPSKLLQEG